MEGLKRKSLQGVTNIVRFNWHFYVIAFIVMTPVFFSIQFFPETVKFFIFWILLAAFISILLSLGVSYYIYDLSNLYSLDWLNSLTVKKGTRLVNINAGFDETSALLLKKFPGTQLVVFDFYDPQKHTEVSIERARRAYPAFPGTKMINTSSVPLEENSVDHIFLILAAHEIRDYSERISFFKQLNKALEKDGKIIVVEHQRDLYNFIVYNIGCFHFFSSATWKKTFQSANLSIAEEFRITPFIATFILQKNGTTS
jgi:hypothetical protein